MQLHTQQCCSGRSSRGGGPSRAKNPSSGHPGPGKQALLITVPSASRHAAFGLTSHSAQEFGLLSARGRWLEASGMNGRARSSKLARAATTASSGTTTAKADSSKVAAIGNKVLVRISVPFRVNFGEVIKVVGSGRSLGEWDAIKAPRFEWTEGDIWVGNLVMDAGQEEFKVVVYNERTRAARWESSANRLLKVPDGPGTLTLSCYWNQPSTSGWFVGGKVDLSNVKISTSEPSAAAKSSASASSSKDKEKDKEKDRERSGSPEPSVLLKSGWDAMLKRSGSPEPARERSSASGSSSSSSSGSSKSATAKSSSSGSSSSSGGGGWASRLSSGSASAKASRWRSVVMDDDDEDDEHDSRRRGASSDDEEDDHHHHKRSSSSSSSSASKSSGSGGSGPSREATLASMRERLMSTLSAAASSSSSKEKDKDGSSSSSGSKSSSSSSGSGGSGSSSRQFSALRTPAPTPVPSGSGGKRWVYEEEEEDDDWERDERRYREARRSSSSSGRESERGRERERARARDREGVDWGDWDWQRLAGGNNIVSGLTRSGEALARDLGSVFSAATGGREDRERDRGRDRDRGRGSGGMGERGRDAATAVMRRLEGMDGNAMFKQVRDALNALANTEESAAFQRRRRTYTPGLSEGEQLLRAVTAVVSTKSPSAIRGEAIDIEDLKESYRRKPPLPSITERRPLLKKDSGEDDKPSRSSSSARRWQDDVERSRGGSERRGKPTSDSVSWWPSARSPAPSRGRGRDEEEDEDWEGEQGRASRGRRRRGSREEVSPGLEHLAQMLNQYWESVMEEQKERERRQAKAENPKVKFEVELPVKQVRDPAVLGGVAVVTAAVLAILGTDQYGMRQNLAARTDALRAAIVEPLPSKKTPQPARGTATDAKKATTGGGAGGSSSKAGGGGAASAKPAAEAKASKPAA